MLVNHLCKFNPFLFNNAAVACFRQPYVANASRNITGKRRIGRYVTQEVLPADPIGVCVDASANDLIPLSAIVEADVDGRIEMANGGRISRALHPTAM